MKILVIGSGGREHALCHKISKSSNVSALYCAPGNDGMLGLAEKVPIGASDIEQLAEFAYTKKIDITVVGPEAPLAAGIADYFYSNGISVIGPSSKASMLEASKVFAKEFMNRNKVPTARYEIYDTYTTALSDIQTGKYSFPLVVKAEGLAAGKGVIIAQDRQQAEKAIEAIMVERRFGSAGDRIVVEEFLSGEEASFMVFSDGTNILPMLPSQDHKAVYDGDRGPNTGGMGAYSSDVIMSSELREEILNTIIRPTIDGMNYEGNSFKGILYAGLMLTAKGPKVLEFNVRFGDPETQAVLPRLESDLPEIFQALSEGLLNKVDARWRPGAAACVVMVSKGYPGSYEKGKKISGLQEASEMEDTIVFHAGTKYEGGSYFTNGGRVLGVTALGKNLPKAIEKAYKAVKCISFEGMHYRRDIGKKGLKKL